MIFIYFVSFTWLLSSILIIPDQRILISTMVFEV